MLTTILFCLSLALSLWLTVLIIVRTIYKEKMMWQFIAFAISWTLVITHFMNIW